MLPWVVIAVSQYHINSLWYFLMVAGIVGADKIIEFGLRSYHESTSMARGTFLLLIPLAVLFYHFGRMTASELFWSFVGYKIAAATLARGIYGTVNAVRKRQYFGLSGNPYHVAFTAQPTDHADPAKRIQKSVLNRISEMEAEHNNETRRLALFQERCLLLEYVTMLRSLQPLLIAGFLPAAVLSRCCW